MALSEIIGVRRRLSSYAWENRGEISVIYFNEECIDSILSDDKKDSPINWIRFIHTESAYDTSCPDENIRTIEAGNGTVNEVDLYDETSLYES